MVAGKEVSDTSVTWLGFKKHSLYPIGILHSSQIMDRYTIFCTRAAPVSELLRDLG